MSQHSQQGQRGFSLMEMLIVVAVLSVVMGAIFSTILDGMKKYRLEENRVNATQESREFLDQIVRDLHSAGYPGLKMFTPSALAAPAVNNSNVASGLVAVSATDLWFEGDIDDSGTVQSVRYTLQTDANGDCPCVMMRSALPTSSFGVSGAVTIAMSRARVSARRSGGTFCTRSKVMSPSA